MLAVTAITLPINKIHVLIYNINFLDFSVMQKTNCLGSQWYNCIDIMQRNSFILHSVKYNVGFQKQHSLSI